MLAGPQRALQALSASCSAMKFARVPGAQVGTYQRLSDLCRVRLPVQVPTMSNKRAGKGLPGVQLPKREYYETDDYFQEAGEQRCTRYS